MPTSRPVMGRPRSSSVPLRAEETLAWKPLLTAVATHIQRGRAVFLGVKAPVGLTSRKVFLNERMGAAVAARDLAAALSALRAAYASAQEDFRSEVAMKAAPH